MSVAHKPPSPRPPVVRAEVLGDRELDNSQTINLLTQNLNHNMNQGLNQNLARI